MTYRGNPSLWNRRSETQQAKEAAREAAAVRLLELEREAAEVAGIAIRGPRRKRTAPEPVAPAIESTTAPEAEPIQAKEASEEQEHKPWQ